MVVSAPSAPHKGWVQHSSSTRVGLGRGFLRLNPVLLLAVHVAALVGVVVVGWSWSWVLGAVVVYYLRMIAVTAGYHRYFAHRTFHTSRIFQLLLALAAQSAAQKGVLWWASHHRWHHRYADTARDVHSPRRRGFW